MKLFLILVCVAALLSGCGSGKSSENAVKPLALMPRAESEPEWAIRVVNRFLRPLNNDLRVVNGLHDPTVVVYITNQNKTTLSVVDKGLADLEQCRNKLLVIGPPPPQSGPFERVYKEFKAACTGYVPIAKTLRKAVLFWSSGRADVIPRGYPTLRSTAHVANVAGDHYAAGIRIAQGLPEFRRAGLKPSV
jgi:hypothetical protein